MSKTVFNSDSLLQMNRKKYAVVELGWNPVPALSRYRAEGMWTRPRSRLALAGLGVGLMAAQAQESVPTELDRMIVHGTRPADVLDLEGVTSTGTRLGVRVLDVPASVYSLEQPAFQARGNRTAMEAVETVVGFVGANSPGNGATFSTRGFTGDDVQQLWDGIRLINPAMSARPLDTFNLRAIEIIKGPASVLHGEGAVGASINFLPKEPSRERFVADGLASYGSWNTVRTGVGVGGPMGGGFSGRVDFSRNASDTFQEGGGYELYNLSAAVRYDVSDDFHVTLYGEALKDDIDAYFGVPLVDGKLDRRLAWENYNVSDNDMQSETYWLRMKSEWDAGEVFSLKNLAYGAVANRDWRNAEGYSFDPVAGVVTLRDLGIVEHEQELFGDRIEGLFVHDLAGRENRLVLGGDFKRTTFFRLADFPSGTSTVNAFSPIRPTYAQAAGSGIPSQRGADYEILQAGPFLEDQYKVFRTVTLVGGVRYDYINNEVSNRDNGRDYGKSFDPVTYRGGLVWEFVSNSTLYGQYTVGAGAPRSLVNLGGAAFSGYSFELEETEQYEVGLKHLGWGGRAEATLAWFGIQKDRVRTFRSGSERVGEAAGETQSQGIEFEGVLRPVDGLTLGANFTVLQVEIERDGFAEDGKRPSNVPEQAATGFASYRFPFGLEVGGEVRAVGNRLGNDPSGPRFEMDDYVLLGAHAAYTWKKVTLTVRGRNLSDERYLAWSEDDYGNQALVGTPASVEVELTARF